ncbi:MAG: uroporphyrinogen-III C-methyltransferase [Bacteroidales bacterium]|nr:uroporphyrinogen-III C-methyltransferase [Bacteroidales bacterium]
MGKVRVIARESRLSQIQVREVMEKHPETEYEIEVLSSYGDKHKEISLLDGKAPADMFTRELDEALIHGRADVAIHSAKDLPYPLDERLEVIALYPPFDQSDSLVSKGHRTLKQLPAGSKIGTSSAVRRRGIAEIRPDLEIVSIRGCIEERVRQVRDGELDGAIIATCALRRLGMEGEISEVLPFETHPLQGYLAVTALKGRQDLKEQFSGGSVLETQGEVTLVGFGPGDPELMTVAGAKAVEAADIIFYDDLTDREYIERQKGEAVYVGKRSGKHQAEQADINRLLLEAAREGKRVVRLKGGDPMMFAHAGEEIEYLQSNLVNVRVIPGVTAASALAAAAKISLTHRGISSSVSMVNGHAKQPIVPDTDTIVYYMGASQLEEIGKRLIAEGRAETTPVLLGYNISRPDEKLFETTLGQLKGDYPTPLIVLIGNVAALRRKAASEIEQTLYTGLSPTAPDQTHTPLIEIESTEWEQPAEGYDYLLFTSRNAVRAWFGKAGTNGAQVVSIGTTTTAALVEAGVAREDIIQSDKDDSYGVIELFWGLDRGRVVIPRSDIALQIIPNGLREIGYTVETVTVYKTVMPRRPRKVNLENVRRVVFTSPSTVDNFIKLYGELPQGIAYETRGRITHNHLKNRQNEAI